MDAAAPRSRDTKSEFEQGLKTFTMEALAGDYEALICLARRPDGSLSVVSLARNTARLKALLYLALAATEDTIGRNMEAAEDASGVDV